MPDHALHLKDTHKNVTGPYSAAHEIMSGRCYDVLIRNLLSLQGSVSVNETIELPALKLQRPVKSMQMFKKPVNKAVQGDRLGICVTQLDPGLIERGLVCAPGTVPTFTGAVAVVEKIRFYAGKVRQGHPGAWLCGVVFVCVYRICVYVCILGERGPRAHTYTLSL